VTLQDDFSFVSEDTRVTILFSSSLERKFEPEIIRTDPRVIAFPVQAKQLTLETVGVRA
jgi:hypothetical protein